MDAVFVPLVFVVPPSGLALMLAARRRRGTGCHPAVGLLVNSAKSLASLGSEPAGGGGGGGGGDVAVHAPSGPTQKVMYALADNDEFDRNEIPTYEEVARLMPYPSMPRPIVLIGPPGVGRNELKRRLIALDPDKFRTTIPCKLSIWFS